MKHQGSCHCGNVKFEVDAEFETGIACNCSMCQRKGSLLAFVPLAQFKLVSGEDSLRDYQFGKKSIHHYFCSNCGVTSFCTGKLPDGREMRAINLRCIENIDLSSVTVSLFDGKKI